MWHTRGVVDEQPFLGVQLILNTPPGDSISITQDLHVHSRGDTCYYYLGHKCIRFHRLDDRVERNLCLARLAQLGLASASQLAAVHQISARTVKRALQRLEEGGAEAFFNTPARPGRPLAIQDPQLLARAAEMLLGGVSLWRTARELGLNYQTLRNYKRAGRLPSRPPDEDQPEPNGDLEPGDAPPQDSDPGRPDSPRSLDKQQRNLRDAAAPQGRAGLFYFRIRKGSGNRSLCEPDPLNRIH